MSEIYTPWQGSNGELDSSNPRGITKSGVGSQDNISLEDALSTNSISSWKSALDTTLTSLANIGGNTYAKSIVNTAYAAKSGKNIPTNTADPAESTLNVNFKQLKNEKFKTISLSSTIGQYNSLLNLVGTASGMYVGTLGKDAWSNIADDALGMAMQALTSATANNTDDVWANAGANLASGAATNLITIIDKAVKNRKAKKSDKKIVSTIDIDGDNYWFKLAKANYYNILTDKPGRPINEIGLNNFSNKTEKFDLITEDELNDFEEKYKFLSQGDGDNEYTTNTELLDNVLTSLQTNGIQHTIIDSIIRKEVNISTNQENVDINDYELDEDLNDIQDFFDTEDTSVGTKQFPRIVKNRIFNRVNNIYREIGGLYIEPFYSGKALKCFEIPFEFNPNINEAASSAQYDKADLLGRVLPIRNYVSSDAGTISIETQYLATSNGKLINRTNPWINGWMTDWTPDRLAIIERQYRALTLPYINGATFVRPPIVRIKLRSRGANTESNIGSGTGTKKLADLQVGDLFRYPSLGEGDNQKIQITSKFNGETRDKRYIVTNVQILPLEFFGNSYYYENSEIFGNYSANSSAYPVRRNGFKVMISLAETTKNFLDLIPNYGEYIGDSDSEEINYTDVGLEFLGIDKNKFDLWSCLDAKVGIDLSKIRDISDSNDITSGFPLVTDFNNELGFTIDDSLSGTDSTEELTERELLEYPNKNLSKDFNEYLSDLKSIGKTTSEIMNMLYYSQWGIEGKSSSNKFDWNKAFYNWFFGYSELNSTYTEKDINKNWNTYYEAIKNLNLQSDEKTYLTDTELISNISSYWKKIDDYKQWAINSVDVDNLSISELKEILGADGLITKCRNSSKDYENSEYNQWLRNGEALSELQFDSFISALEYANYTKGDIFYIIENVSSDTKNTKDYLDYVENNFSEYLKYNSLLSYISRKIDLLDSSSIKFQSKRTSVYTNILNNIVNAIKDTGITIDTLGELEEFLSDLTNVRYGFSFMDSSGVDIYPILLKAYSKSQVKTLLEKTEWSKNENFQNWNQTGSYLDIEPITIKVDDYEYNYFQLSEEETEEDKTIFTFNGDSDDNSDLYNDGQYYVEENYIDFVSILLAMFENSDDNNNYVRKEAE